ncbi:hypothetical protein COX73_02980 [bacterium (Candidatus Gribaldobacteria) CG_4_10_14_0_2_um_filter_36_18]|uniref:Uncharacterized protein n=1 Tax=bacterium (Candidatus Gribaldobacteria) CG_4_10_14_0_2_um_filter_36_18 TaxID=2014264 RepID=A0A2M7VJJ2_9BACT|nr:MAG: hypothetical protein COX73_02980 [bacterium (Candidatus Gribaldobacteria) CG_4_10_14_0_2_um_filter_36_18]
MKVKDLNLLPKYYSRNWYSGIDKLGPFSWGDLILEKIDGDKLFLKLCDDIKGTGEVLSESFKKKEYNKLSGEEKKKINDIFSNNIDKTIKEILEIDFI